MRSNLRLFVLCFTATAAFGQHGGGFRGGAGTSFGHGGFAIGGPTLGFPERAIIPQIGPLSPFGADAAQFRRQFARGRWSGNDFFPFFPFYGDYGYGDYASGYPPGYNVFVLQPLEPNAPQPVAAKPIHSVIHEYPENEKAAGAGDAASFSIALKDGSTNSAETVWVQHDQLHFVDSQGRQEVLALDLIDRYATERLNREKNLRFQLPPI